MLDNILLFQMIDSKLKQYKHTHGKAMSCEALAQMLSSTLYYRRFFPYYTYNIIAGMDNQGKGNYCIVQTVNSLLILL